MPSPTAADVPTAGRSRRTGWLVAALAVLTGLLGVLAVLAPVDADDPVVSWPRAGTPPTSTVLPLSPYRPLQLDATVPCRTLGGLAARPGGGEALRTLPADVGTAPGEGLVVAAAGDGGRAAVTITASGTELVSEPVPGADCAYRVVADAAGVRVTREGPAGEVTLADRPGLLVPQVAELQTDIEQTDGEQVGAEQVEAARGLAVTLHTDARYQSSPTPLKTALLIAHVVALLALLVLAWRRWPGRNPGLVRPRPSWADAVVLGVSALWVLIGPVNIDDSWYLLMSRGATESDYIGNAIYQFNVTENPFVASQYLMQAWGALGGWSLGWQRLLPLAYGLVGYALLRVLVATVLQRAGRGALVPWAVAAAYLVWWLPYGITLRPEPLIAMGTAAVMVLAELARRRRSVGVLAAATAAAALTVTVSPTGLVAVAPLLLCLPWLWQWWRSAGLGERVGAVLLAGAAASVVVPIGFADATLGDVLESTAVHRWYYRQHDWYEEYLHYANLLAMDDRGAWGKRLPVLLTLAALVAAAIAAGRRAGTGGPSGRLLGAAGLITALGLASMALTPTKWVNHFGAVATPAALLLAVALIRGPLPRRPGTAALAVGTAALVGAVTVSFAGPNLWRPFGDWGQPFGGHTEISTPYLMSLLTPAVGPVPLRNPLPWLALAGLAWWWWARRRSRPGPDRVVLGAATVLGVLLMVAVFSVAPLRQFPGTSVALMNLRALTGEPCGLAPAVRVLTPATPGLAEPVGSAQVTGGFTEGLPAGLEAPPAAPAGTTVWHDDVPGAGAGGLTTPWYPLPEAAPQSQVVVPLAGHLGPEQEIALEFAVGDPRDPGEVRSVVLDPAGTTSEWVERTVAVAEADGAPATAVRVVAQDRDVTAGSWMAVAQPRLTAPRPVTDVIAGRPVFADQVSAALWACTDQIALRDGIAEAPALRLRAGDGLEGAVENNSVFAPNGGTLVQLDRVSRFVELPSRLDPPGAPTLGWGHVEEVVYDHPVGLVDLRVDTVRRAGWTRLPTLAGEPYTGRIYIG